MSKYKVGFLIKGFVALMLVMIPNLIWMIALLIVLIPRNNRSCKSIKTYFQLVTFCIVIYYIMWLVYYTGMVYPWMFVGMAAFPSIYFVFVELWLDNYIAITFSNYIQ